MIKVILDFTEAETKEEIHAILRRELDLPAYYGANLDALYDCLTEIGEDTAAAVYCPDEESPAGLYLQKLRRVFADAEEENGHLAVFFFPPEKPDEEMYWDIPE